MESGLEYFTLCHKIGVPATIELPATAYSWRMAETVIALALLVLSYIVLISVVSQIQVEANEFHFNNALYQSSLLTV